MAAVAELQRVCQARRRALPVYTIDSVGTAIRPSFACRCTLWTGEQYLGDGGKKAEAKNGAALAALAALGIAPPAAPVSVDGAAGDSDIDYVNRLLHVCQQLGQAAPVCRFERAGPNHRSLFRCWVTLWEGSEFCGDGARKQKAKVAAHRAALEHVEQRMQHGASVVPTPGDGNGTTGVSGTPGANTSPAGLAPGPFALAQGPDGGKLVLRELPVYDHDHPLELPPSMFARPDDAGDRCASITEARPYQLSLYRTAAQENTIAYLKTGSGKTFIAVMLIRQLAKEFRERTAAQAQPGAGPGPGPGSRFLAVFLVDRVQLVIQQERALQLHTGLSAKGYFGDQATKLKPKRWKREIAEQEVLVLTAQVFLNILTHGFLTIQQCQLVIFDECHHATKSHPYLQIMTDHYFKCEASRRPRVFGMTASPIKAKASHDLLVARKHLSLLQRNLDCRIHTVSGAQKQELEAYAPKPREALLAYRPRSDGQRTALEVEFLAVLAEVESRLHATIAAIEAAKGEGEKTSHKAPDHETADVQYFANSHPVAVDTNVQGRERPVRLAEAIIREHRFGMALEEFEQALTKASGAPIPFMFLAYWSLEEYIEGELKDVVMLVTEESGQVRVVPSSRVILAPQHDQEAGVAAVPPTLRCISALTKLVRLLSTCRAICDELGFWAGSWFWCGIDDDQMLRVWVAMSPELRAGLPLYDEARNQRLPDRFCNADLEPAHLSPKAQALLGLMAAHAAVPGFSALVFTERRSVARALDALFNATASLNALQFACIVGQASGGGDRGLRVSEQKQILRAFREQHINVLVATSVAEEGMDIPACALVVRMTPPPTSASYVQSRGRARRPDSVFVMMVEHNDAAALRQLSDVRVGVKTMQLALEMDLEPLQPRELGDATEAAGVDDVFRIEATQAQVTLQTARPLLSKYCASLPSDAFYSPQPEYDIVPAGTPPGASGERFGCVLTMPLVAPVRRVETTARSAKVASQRAAVHCIRKLHALGHFTDHLLPVTDLPGDWPGRHEPEQDAGLDAEQDNGTWEYVPKPVGCLAGPLSGAAGSPWYLHALEIFEDTGEAATGVGTGAGAALLSLEQLPFAILARTPLPVVGPMRISDTHCLRVTGSEGAVTLTQAEERLLGRFHTALLANVQSLEPPAAPVFEVEFGVAHQYLVCPTTTVLKAAGQESTEVSFAVIEELLPELEACAARPAEGGADEDATGATFASLPTAQTLLGASVAGRVVVSKFPPHKRFIALGWAEGRTARSTPADPRTAQFGSHMGFAEKAHGLGVAHPDAPLLEVTHEDVQSRLKAGYSRSLDAVAELCWLSPVPRAALALPLVLSTLEATLKLREGTAALAAAYSPLPLDLERTAFAPSLSAQDLPLLMLALVSPATQVALNNDRLEFVGDAVLKAAVSVRLAFGHPEGHHGMLCRRRAHCVSNAELRRLVKRSGLHEHLCSTGPRPSHWKPPGWALAPLRVGNKTLADTYEAVVGALYLADGGEQRALAFLSETGAHAAGEQLHRPGREADWPVPAFLADRVGPLERRLRTESARLDRLEASISYKLQDRARLLEAITHASFADDPATPCYQRLQFIGDAVLDAAVSAHLYRRYPEEPTARLSDLKHAALSNLNLARVARAHGLHACLQHHSAALMKALQEFVEAGEGDQDEDVELAVVPKALAELLQAVAGVVFLEAGLDGMWAVFEPLMSATMARYAAPGTVAVNPKCSAYHMAQLAGSTLAVQSRRAVSSGEGYQVAVLADGETLVSTTAGSRLHGEREAFSRLVASHAFHSHLLGRLEATAGSAASKITALRDRFLRSSACP